MPTAKRAVVHSPGHDIKLPTFFDICYNGSKETIMDKYKCLVCGYIYDPAKGDPDNGIEPGIAFEVLPDDWVCPECGAPKSEFEKV